MGVAASLICWGGRLGKSVTANNTTDRITLTNHGIRATGLKLWITSGTLPTGLSSVVPYWGKYYADNEFELYTDAAMTVRALFSTNGASLIMKSDLIVSPATRLAAYGLSDLSRWGDSGAEKIYDGLVSWYSNRLANGNTFTEELCEIGEAYDEITSTALDMNMKAPQVLITTKINGIRTPAFHYGVFGAGYVHVQVGYGFVTRSAGITLEGFALRQKTGASAPIVQLLNFNSVADKILVSGVARTANSEGFRLAGVGTKATNCIAIGCGRGFSVTQYTGYEQVFNCLATDNTIGFGNPYDGATNGNGTAVNCVSIGNTTNWFVYGPHATCDHNVGLAGEAWLTAGGVRMAVDANWNTTTPLFADYANKDFRPHPSLNANAAVLVENGIDYYGMTGFDAANNVVPNYMNGAAATTDIGPFEFDHGYGPWPASTTVTFTGIAAGSEIHVYDNVGNEIAGTESCALDQALTWGIPTNPLVTITIIKRGLNWRKFPYLSSVGEKTLPIFQTNDLGYNNPA